MGTPSINTGTTISSTGGKITFGEGGAINGGALELNNSTLAVGSSLSKTGGTLTLTSTDLELLSDLSFNSDAAVEVNELRLEDKILTLQSNSSFTVADQLVLDNSDEQVIWDENTNLILSGGVKLNTNGILAWENPNNL